MCMGHMESSDWSEDAAQIKVTSFRRSRSRRNKRDQNRKAEEEAQQRLTGDAHWTKLLQVNGSELDRSLVTRLSCKRKNSSSAPARHTSRETSRERDPCGGDNSCSAGAVLPRPRDSLLMTITSRIRHWIQSRRKYEISPREPFVSNSSSSSTSTPIKRSAKSDSFVKDSVLDCDAALNRCGAGRLSPRLPLHQPNGFAVATAAETGKIPLQKSPVARRSLHKTKPPTDPAKKGASGTLTLTTSAASVQTTTSLTPKSANVPFKAKSKSPVVDIRIEVVDVSGQTPSPLSPSAHRLLASSRRHLLRQSRSKLKSRGVLITSLVPGSSNLTRQPLTTTISCPPQAEAAAAGVGGTGVSDLNLLQASLKRSHSWPLPRRKAIPEEEECPDSAKEEALLSVGLNGQDSLEDCSIRFEDLDLGECIKVGRRCKIYRARWHGDVFVHLFGELVKRPDREGFWRDVAKLCRIRHENINLFMGACTMAPNLAVITSYLTGKSLYEHIHVKREKMTLHTRVQILQGIAQGMGYLHAKGIVLRKLNTANIFLTPRVKVSAIDFSLPEARHNRKDYAVIPHGHLTYVAPELLSTLKVIPPRLVPTVAPSSETDVFAFGTIMYEVLAGTFPYLGFPPEAVIWSVCRGHRQNLANINCTIPLKTLIEDCWAHEPLYRPDFPELSKELHKNSPQYKRHSSSEPERLNRTPGAFD